MSNKLNTVQRPIKSMFVAGGITLASGLVAMMAGSASAAVFTQGTTQTVGYSQNFGGGIVSATVDFTLSNLTNNQAEFIIKVTNNTILGSLTNAGLASIGFSSDPDATAGSATLSSVLQPDDTNVFSGVGTPDSIPSLGLTEICTWAGNNCNGGPQNSLLAVGQTDTFKLTYLGNFSNNITLDNFGVKFQTSAGSTEFYGQAVPEPLTILGALTAAGFGVAFKRRTTKTED